MKKTILAILSLFLFTACATNTESELDSTRNDFQSIDALYAELEANPSLEKADFAGGCFWCTEAFLQEIPGVEEVISGYLGGSEAYPTYTEVVKHETSHREGVRVYYNPDETSYETILAQFWNSIDPTDAGGQFADRGFNYSTAIYTHNEEQESLAETTKQELIDSGRFDTVATEILPYSSFYPAEDAHQDFYLINSSYYKNYKTGSGRDAFFEEFLNQ